MQYEWKTDTELRRIYNQQPDVAEARGKLAVAFRKMRATHPELARLLARRIKAAQDEFVKRVWSEGSVTANPF